jgi:hypothetical protein
MYDAGTTRRAGAGWARRNTASPIARALVDPHRSPDTPLYQTTTFRFGGTADLLEVVEGRRGENNACLSRRLRVACAGSQFK